MQIIRSLLLGALLLFSGFTIASSHTDPVPFPNHTTVITECDRVVAVITAYFNSPLEALNGKVSVIYLNSEESDEVNDRLMYNYLYLLVNQFNVEIQELRMEDVYGRQCV